MASMSPAKFKFQEGWQTGAGRLPPLMEALNNFHKWQNRILKVKVWLGGGQHPLPLKPKACFYVIFWL